MLVELTPGMVCILWCVPDYTITRMWWTQVHARGSMGFVRLPPSQAEIENENWY